MTPPPPPPCPQLCASPVLPGPAMLDHILGKLWAAWPWLCRQLRASHLLLWRWVPGRNLSKRRSVWNFSIHQGDACKHWLAVSRGKVASQKVSGFAQRNVCLSLAYCHHFRPHFWGFSPQGCGIPGASTALESQQVILTMETGWSLRTRNKKGGRGLHSLAQSLFFLFTLRSPPLIQWPTAAHQFAALVFFYLLILFSTYSWVARWSNGENSSLEKRRSQFESSGITQTMWCYVRDFILSETPVTHLSTAYNGLPRWLGGKEPTCQCRRRRRYGLDPWVGKIPWRRKWPPTSVCLQE